MDGRSPCSWASLDPRRRQQPGQKRAECLIGIECPLRQLVLGTSRIPLDLSKRIPLHEAHAQERETLIQYPVVAVLNSLDQPSQMFGFA